jgi:PAS domain S-box-containing protein
MEGLHITDKIQTPREIIMRKTYIYKGFERFWHWSQAVLIIFLIITGFEVHGSYIIFGYETAVLYHDIAAWSLIILVVFAIFWHFVTGEYKQYLPSTKLVKAQFKYYISGIFSGAPHPTKKSSYTKFNPLQRLTYLGFKVFIIPIQIISGLLYMYYMYPENPIHIGGLDITAVLHTFGAFVLIAFLIAHLYLLTTSEHPKAAFNAMIHGWEELEKDPEEEHKEHMQSAVDKAVAGYYRVDINGILIDVNEAWLNLYKCSDKNKILGKHSSVTRNEKNQKQLSEVIDRVLNGESLRGIYTERRCFDGTSGKHILSMNPTYERGKIIGAEGFIIDISDVSSVQEQMYHSVRNSEAGYYKIDMNGYYVDVNDAWLRLYKCDDRSNIIDKHYSISRNENDIKRIDEIFNLVTKQGQTISSEIATRRCKDGSTGKHILSANPVYDCEKIVGLEGFILDISDLDINA